MKNLKELLNKENGIDEIINDFFSYCYKDNNIKIYNEINFQIEFGIFLKNTFIDSNNYDIEFERNIKNHKLEINIGQNDFKSLIKKEIDIVIINKKDIKEKYAIELKLPNGDNNGYTDEFYEFIKDIKFIELLKENGFSKTFCITLVRNKIFYENNGRIDKNDIYKYFKNNSILTGKIIRKKLNRKMHIEEEKILFELKNKYIIDWKDIKNYQLFIESEKNNDECKYYTITL